MQYIFTGIVCILSIGIGIFLGSAIVEAFAEEWWDALACVFLAIVLRWVQLEFFYTKTSIY